MYDDDDEPEGPKSSFTIYHSEGNVHFNQGEYKKALDCYTQVKKDTPSLAYTSLKFAHVRFYLQECCLFVIVSQSEYFALLHVSLIWFSVSLILTSNNT